MVGGKLNGYGFVGYGMGYGEVFGCMRRSLVGRVDVAGLGWLIGEVVVW